jgi:hypothetical protein
MLIVGEVHTNVLRERDPVTVDHARHLLDLVPGEPVLVSERPMTCVRSPATPVGVDCPLAAGGARQVRGVGTALHRSAITGGHILQSAAYATVLPATQSARQPWSYYLSRPGVIEAFGRVRWPEMADSLAASRPATTELDLGAIAGRAADDVQRRAVRNTRYTGQLRLRSARLRLRWVVETDPDRPRRIHFVVRNAGLRVLWLAVTPATAESLAAVAEDVALHDWLITTLMDITRKAAIGVLPRQETLGRLVPAIDYLLHLWMPKARGDELSDEVWAMLEHRGGFSRQWESLVYRIRDQLSVAMAAPHFDHRNT